jgi:O-antigen ligase
MLCLFAAPFRSSAGLRGGLLTLAALLLIADASRRHDWRSLWPARSIATDGVLLWLLAVLAWCAISRDVQQSFSAFKGEVAIPLLAGLVFYALTRDERDIQSWLLALAAGLAGLLVSMFVDPFRQGEVIPRPWYGGVGPVSTWVVGVAALLPFAWQGTGGSRARVTGLVLLLFAAGIAFMSGNRMVWLSLALMLTTFAVLSIREGQAMPKTRTLVGWVLAIGALGVLFFASSEARFDGLVEDKGSVALLLNDNRLALWQEVMRMIVEQPLAGRGFGREVVEAELVARFTDPQHRGLFLQAHNLLFNYALQLGVAGVVAILLLFAALGIKFLFLARQTGVARLAGICGCMLLVGVFSKNMTDDFFIRQNALLFWAVTGMLAGAARWPDRIAITKP